MSPPEPADRELLCERCGDAFVFATGEQVFFGRRGFPPPRRCADCRQSRKALAGLAPPPLALEEEERQARCSACGALTQLPFLPVSRRPLYCEACFRHR